MSTSRYTADIDLEDVNNSHSLAILQVTPGSVVLDIGAADGSVARRLVERGCQVVAVEGDAKAARAAEEVCARVVAQDVETLDLDATLEGAEFDCVLLLDVLEHLRDPLGVLRSAAGRLKPSGRMILSVPNVTHAALRLQLLAGRFQYTQTGLLDRSHLHLFDRPGLERLLDEAQLTVIDRMRTTAGVTETEIEIDLAAFPEQAVSLATSGEDAETYQFVYVVSPVGTQTAAPGSATLGEALQRRATEAERLRSEAEAYVRTLQGRVSELDEESRQIAQRERQERERAGFLESELRARMDELERVYDELRHAKMDIAIKDAQLAHVQAELAPMRTRLDRAEHLLGSVRGRMVHIVGNLTGHVPVLHRALKQIANRVADRK